MAIGCGGTRDSLVTRSMGGCLVACPWLDRGPLMKEREEQPATDPSHGGAVGLISDAPLGRVLILW